jgi:hypothetical protein
MPTSILRTFAAAATLVLFVVGAPAARAVSDLKATGAGACLPYAPDTTYAELSYGPTGIYNGGTTNEKVMCTLLRDQETAYAMDGVGVVVYYRVLGGTPARMTCTLFVGSTSMQTDAVYTSTAAGGLASGGGRDYLLVYGGPQSLENNALPLTLLCVIPPKTSFAAIKHVELDSTDGSL